MQTTASVLLSKDYPNKQPFSMITFSVNVNPRVILPTAPPGVQRQPPRQLPPAAPCQSLLFQFFNLVEIFLHAFNRFRQLIDLVCDTPTAPTSAAPPLSGSLSALSASAFLGLSASLPPFSSSFCAGRSFSLPPDSDSPRL